MAIFNSYVKLPEGTPFGNLDFQRGFHPGTGRVCTGSGSAVDRRTVRSAPQESDTKAAKKKEHGAHHGPGNFNGFFQNNVIL